MRANRDPRELSARNLRIYAMRQKGLTLAAIGQRFGLSKWRISMIVERELQREALAECVGKCQYISAPKA